MSTPSAPGDASTIVAATKWRQHVAVDVSPQNRFAFRIKPRSGDRNDRCRHFVAFEFWAVNFLWTYVHSYTLSPLSWLVCRTQGKATAIRSLSQSSDDGEADSCGSTLPTMWHCSIPATKFRELAPKRRVILSSFNGVRFRQAAPESIHQFQSLLTERQTSR